MAWEWDVLLELREWYTPWLNSLMAWVSFLGNSGWVWIVAGLALLVPKKTRRCGILVLMALLLGLLIANLTIKPLVARPRPFHLRELTLLIPLPGEWSFPSGHSVSSAAAATVMLLRHRKLGAVAVPLALLIAFSRLYLTVHYPTDVLAGVLLGAAIGVFCHLVPGRWLDQPKKAG